MVLRLGWKEGLKFSVEGAGGIGKKSDMARVDIHLDL